MKAFGLHSILKFSCALGEQAQVCYPVSQSVLKLWKAANAHSLFIFSTAFSSSPIFSCLESCSLFHSFCRIHCFPLPTHFLHIFRKGRGGTKHPKRHDAVTPSAGTASVRFLFCRPDSACTAAFMGPL